MKSTNDTLEDLAGSEYKLRVCYRHRVRHRTARVERRYHSLISAKKNEPSSCWTGA